VWISLQRGQLKLPSHHSEGLVVLVARKGHYKVISSKQMESNYMFGSSIFAFKMKGFFQSNQINYDMVGTMMGILSTLLLR